MQSGEINKTVVYVVGPTASGKTDLSVKIAKKLGGVIICGDSMQIYKNMPIATAAPTDEEKASVPHRLFEFLNPDDNFSVSEYVKLANAEIEKLHNKNILPIVVGGTGLYIDSLAENIDFGEDNNSGDCRALLEKRLENEGLETLYNELLKIDVEAAKKISQNDAKRIIRALEVFYTSGDTITSRVKKSRSKGIIYNNIFIGVTYKDREKLYDRINRRVDLMKDAGLVNEAQTFLALSGKTSAQAIGHKELLPYFEGNATLEECLMHLKMQTRRYAKRQMTWFNRNKNINWIFMDESENPLEEALNIINSTLYGKNSCMP